MYNCEPGVVLAVVVSIRPWGLEHAEAEELAVVQFVELESDQSSYRRDYEEHKAVLLLVRKEFVVNGFFLLFCNPYLVLSWVFFPHLFKWCLLHLIVIEFGELLVIDSFKDKVQQHEEYENNPRQNSKPCSTKNEWNNCLYRYGEELQRANGGDDACDCFLLNSVNFVELVGLFL